MRWWWWWGGGRTGWMSKSFSPIHPALLAAPRMSLSSPHSQPHPHPPRALLTFTSPHPGARTPVWSQPKVILIIEPRSPPPTVGLTLSPSPPTPLALLTPGAWGPPGSSISPPAQLPGLAASSRSHHGQISGIHRPV